MTTLIVLDAQREVPVGSVPTLELTHETTRRVEILLAREDIDGNSHGALG